MLELTQAQIDAAKEARRKYDCQYRQKNREKLRQNQARYRLKNKYALNAKARIWAMNNKDKVRRTNRRYKIKHPELYTSSGYLQAVAYRLTLRGTYGYDMPDIEREARQNGELPLYERPQQITDFLRKKCTFSDDY